MKKTLKFILIVGVLLALVVTLTGCGKETKEVNEVIDNIIEEVNELNQETTTDNFTRGEWKENEYSNDFANIKFELPEGWEKSTDEEIAAMMNVGVELLNDDQQKLVEKAGETGIYCMQATDPNTAASVMVIMEKPVIRVTPEFYLSNVKQQLEAVEVMNYEIGEQYTTNISGEEYTTIDAKASASGITIDQYYFSKAEGKYIVSILITATQEGQLEEILTYFK